MDPLISVIVPVYNSETTILRCLEGLNNLSYSKYDVILVDDGSTDGSAHIIKDFIKGKPKFRYFYQENKGPAAARNAGVANVKGEIIAFTDSDCIPNKDWLSVTRWFEDTQVVGVEGRIDTDSMSVLTQSIRTNNGGRYLTANIFYRRTKFLEEKFDERFKFAFREDTDLGLRMAKKGTIVYENKASVYHIPREVSLFKLMKKQRMYSYEPLFAKKHGMKLKRGFLENPLTRARASLLALLLVPVAIFTEYTIITAILGVYYIVNLFYFLYIIIKEGKWNFSNILFLPFSLMFSFFTLYWLIIGSIKFRKVVL